MRKPPTKAEITAAALTAVLTLLLLLALFLGSLDYDRASLAADSVPEPDEPMQEELFLDPPLVIGADDASLRESAEPEASPLGLPDQAPVENDVVRTSGENRNPEARSTEKLVKSNRPSSVKSGEPSKKDKPDSKITSTVASRFSGKNGTTAGKHGASGSGGTGEGVKGNVRGRKFLGCPLPKVALREKVVVTVSIRVDEKGRVIEASYKSGTAASAEIRSKCVASARKARWSEQPGASPVGGTITFTIVPKM